MEKYFKEQLRWLKDRGHYDPGNETDRQVNKPHAIYIYPVVAGSTPVTGISCSLVYYR
jgi:hypothetical protein